MAWRVIAGKAFHPLKDAAMNVDRGCRGKRQVGATTIILPGSPLKRDNRYQRDKKHKRCRRRAAIEPLIGHLKSDHRLGRCYLKGSIGDVINLLTAACAWNLKKWLATIFWLLKKPVLSQERSSYDDDDGLWVLWPLTATLMIGLAIVSAGSTMPAYPF